MQAFAADENFDGRIVRGLRRRVPALDIVRIQDLPLSGADDQEVLSWAADQNRVVLTHDISTMTAEAYERVRQGKAMPGIIEVPLDLSIGSAIDDLVLLALASRSNEWEGQVLFLPL